MSGTVIGIVSLQRLGAEIRYPLTIIGQCHYSCIIDQTNNLTTARAFETRRYVRRLLGGHVRHTLFCLYDYCRVGLNNSQISRWFARSVVIRVDMAYITRDCHY